MISLRARLSLWFTLGFLIVTSVFMVFTYQHLDLELRRRTFQSEMDINPHWILHGSYTEEEVRSIMAGLIRASLLYSLPLALATILLGYWIARQSLTPIDNLNKQLQAVNPRTLGERVRLAEADDQFQDLVGHLNDMLARLETSFSEMSEYAAKVAHELRTPLTILRLKVEQAGARVEPELAEELETELHRLAYVVDQSLLIAKAGQGRLIWKRADFDLCQMAAELVSDFELLASAEGRQLSRHWPKAAVVRSDPVYAKQVLHTLMTNALMHGRDNIEVRIRVRNGSAGFLVRNPVRHRPSSAEMTLGLGLRVVRALMGMQPELQLRQHHGQQWHAAQIVFPLGNGRTEDAGSVEVGRPARHPTPTLPIAASSTTGQFGISTEDFAI